MGADKQKYSHEKRGKKSIINAITTRYLRKPILKRPFLTGYRIPTDFIQVIDIEPVALCNLECPFCQVPGWERAKSTTPMSIEFFEKILSEFKNLRQIKLQGMGEPFLNTHLLEMVRIAANRGIDTCVITNGTLLDPRRNEEILDSGLSLIQFSFDGATKSTYEALRKNADFDKVVNNIKLLCELKKKRGSNLRISLVCLVSNDAVLTELPELVRLAAYMGADSVCVKERLKNWIKEDGELRYSFSVKCLKDFPGFESYLDKARILSKELNIEFEFHHDSIFSRSNRCPWPFTSLYISTEGKVVPCCVLAVPETWNMGDLTKDSLKKIFNNRQYLKLREEIYRNRIPPTCKACYQIAG